MEIKQKIYSDLSPKQRAIAALLSVNRDDSAEVDRLLASAPKCGGHGQALLGIGQALEAYNRFSTGAVCIYLCTSGRLLAALSYCSAWVGAGGALNAKRYRENLAVIERLEPRVEKLAGDVYAVRQAAREWCEKHQVPVDVFGQPLCLFPLPDRVEPVSDSEELNVVRSCFDQITLAW
jgi:hypothetical protein